MLGGERPRLNALVIKDICNMNFYSGCRLRMSILGTSLSSFELNEH